MVDVSLMVYMGARSSMRQPPRVTSVAGSNDTMPMPLAVWGRWGGGLSHWLHVRRVTSQGADMASTSASLFPGQYVSECS